MKTEYDLPGLNPRRLIKLMRDAIDCCSLDLSGAVVLTEAASGAYVVTPVLAALAGSRRVFAISRTSRYGTINKIKGLTSELALLAGVDKRLDIITRRTPAVVRRADIVTNSGHVRPIDASMVEWMKSSAVVSLMYEAWEFRPSDLDLAACRGRQIPVAGTNELHPKLNVFGWLGIMAVKLLLNAGIATYRSRVLVLCDNAFSTHLEIGLIGAGALITMAAELGAAEAAGRYDAILVALTPRETPVLKASEAAIIARCWPGAVVVQFFGDIERSAFRAAGIPVWPPEEPRPGHMSILPSEVGPEPVVRLQAGGLKVGEILWREKIKGSSSTQSLRTLAQSGYGTFLADDRKQLAIIA